MSQGGLFPTSWVQTTDIPDSKVHGAHMGPVGPDGPHVGPMNLAIRDIAPTYVPMNFCQFMAVFWGKIVKLLDYIQFLYVNMV